MTCHTSRGDHCIFDSIPQTATPAQIGAFMIAHHIKRPTPEELAGTLDTYTTLVPTLTHL